MIVFCLLIISSQLIYGQFNNMNNSFGVKIQNLSFQDFNSDFTSNELNSIEYSLLAKDGPAIPGDELIKFTQHFYLGCASIVGGFFISLVGMASDVGVLMALGGITMVGGGVLFIESFYHIGKAGKLMNNENEQMAGRLHLGLAPQGISLTINLN